MTSELIKRVRHGSIQGAWADEQEQIGVFRGVPFAQPPVDDLRWQPPQPPAKWDGVRPATSFRDGCTQTQEETNFVWSRIGFATSEDCLYLNVWAPQDAQDAPVMVWFHGGGHSSGLAHAEVFDGTALARRGVVVVTVGYRLGALGFLAHPALAAESPHGAAGNYGLLDKVAALQWVADNIAEFGGDQFNVTIFGQSAGSMSVACLQASPLATGLFHKVIGQSASSFGAMDDGRARGQQLAEQLGVTGTDAAALAQLRALPAEAILAAEGPSGWGRVSKIVVDGWMLPESPYAAFASERATAVPTLVGSAANEGNGLFPLNDKLSEEQLRDRLTRSFGADGTTRILEAYSTDLAVSPGMAAREIGTDQFMAWAMRRWADFAVARDQPTWLYFLSYVGPAFRIYQPDNPVLDLPGGDRSAGAYHSSDLAFVFNNIGEVGSSGVSWNDDDHRLAQTISQYWVNFATSGNPNGPGLPHWSPYSTASRATMELATTPSTTAGVRTEKLDLFDAYAK